jgi:hypothetical protein
MDLTTTTTTIKAGDRLHHWHIISVDGRRATARCRCHQIRIVAIEDLLAGTRTSCGCRPLAPARNKEIHEARQERKRRQNFDWQPERGR